MAASEYHTNDGRVFHPGDEVWVRFAYASDDWQDAWQAGTVVEGSLDYTQGGGQPRVPVWCAFPGNSYGVWYFRSEDIRLRRADNFA